MFIAEAGGEDVLDILMILGIVETTELERVLSKRCCEDWNCQKGGEIEWREVVEG